MAKQSSPLYLEMMMKKVVKEKKWEDVDNLLELLNLHHLERPKPFTHGKKCSNCEHRMHCKTIRCPLCHTDMRKRKRQGEENETEEGKDDEKDDEKNVNECAGTCAQDLTGTEYHTLPCGHKWCFKCIAFFARNTRHCPCHPNDELFMMPEDIVLKYGGVAYKK